MCVCVCGRSMCVLLMRCICVIGAGSLVCMQCAEDKCSCRASAVLSVAMVSQAIRARETILPGHMDRADIFAMCILSIGVQVCVRASLGLKKKIEIMSLKNRVTAVALINKFTSVCSLSFPESSDTDTARARRPERSCPLRPGPQRQSPQRATVTLSKHNVSVRLIHA